MRWEVTYARFIKAKYDEANDEIDSTNSSSEDNGEVRIHMHEMKNMDTNSE